MIFKNYSLEKTNTFLLFGKNRACEVTDNQPMRYTSAIYLFPFEKYKLSIKDGRNQNLAFRLQTL